MDENNTTPTPPQNFGQDTQPANPQTSKTPQQPVVSTQAVEFAPNPPATTQKKTSKKIITLIVLFLVAIIAVASWFLVISRDSETNDQQISDSASNNEETEIAEKSEETLSLYDKSILERVSFKQLEGQKGESGLIELYYEETERYLLVPGIDEYYISVEIIQNDDTNPATISDVSKAFRSAFQNNGFTDYTEPNQFIREYEESQGIVRFKKGDVICSLNVSGGEDQASYVYQACSDVSKVAEFADKMEKFYTAYEASEDYINSGYDGPYYISVDESDALDSEIDGFQYLYGGIGGFGSGASATYVREDGGEWVFFAGRQSTLDCERYADQLFHKALSHEICYKSEAEPEVSVKELYNL